MNKNLFFLIGVLTLGSLSLGMIADTPRVNHSFKETFHKEITENPGINSSQNSREIFAFLEMDCSDSEEIPAKSEKIEMKGIEIAGELASWSGESFRAGASCTRRNGMDTFQSRLWGGAGGWFASGGRGSERPGQTCGSSPS